MYFFALLVQMLVRTVLFSGYSCSDEAHHAITC